MAGMKTTLAALFALTAACLAGNPEIDALTAKRAAAVAKIDETYKAELQKLKAKFMAAGNLEAANEAAKLAGGGESSAIIPDGASENSIVGSKWEWVRGQWIVFDRTTAKLSRPNDTIIFTWRQNSARNIKLEVTSIESKDGHVVSDTKVGDKVSMNISADGKEAEGTASGKTWRILKAS